MAEKFLSIDDMLAVQDVEYRDVAVPEWGGSIRIGSLSAGDVSEWANANEEGLSPKERRDLKQRSSARLIVKSLVDKDGNRVGKDEHVEAFRKKKNAVIERILEQIVSLNGLKITKKSAADAKNDSSETSADVSPTV